jgi:GNAT superfamily N-acetyltransferase
MDYRLRPGTASDTRAVYEVFRHAIAVVYHQFRINDTLQYPTPESLEQEWGLWGSLYEHLARTAEQFWVAESEDGLIGYARSIQRDGLQELTELFIHPQVQSKGLGRALLERAFGLQAGLQGEGKRCIIASADRRALALYLKAGMAARFPIYTFYRAVRDDVRVESDLVFEPLDDTPDCLETLAQIDRQVLGHRRDADHEWLREDRRGFICRRGGQAAGYGYEGGFDGPFALLDEADFPAVLAQAERMAAQAGREEFAVDAPMVNRAAIRYLLGNGFQMGAFIAYMMSDRAFGRFENYLFTSPIFIL